MHIGQSWIGLSSSAVALLRPLAGPQNRPWPADHTTDPWEEKAISQEHNLPISYLISSCTKICLRGTVPISNSPVIPNSPSPSPKTHPSPPPHTHTHIHKPHPTEGDQHSVIAGMVTEVLRVCGLSTAQCPPCVLTTEGLGVWECHGRVNCTHRIHDK